jgi:hypothetical protein
MALKISPTRSGQTKGITLGAIGGAALTGIQAYDTSDNTSNPLSLNALGGNVGIGTNSPTHALHVEATTAVPFKIKSTSTSGTGLYLDNDRSGSKTFGILSGNVAAGYFNIKDEDAGVNRFVISSSGDVGIGTTSPAHKLDVDGAIATRQVRHSIRPTLNLDFANSKELDPRITFYRDSIATYYDSKGVLRYANVNKPRFDHDPATGESKGLLIEEARTNLTDKNNRFNDWHGRNRVDFIENAAKSPDGYYNATKVIDAPNGADARHEFWRNFSAVSGTTYTFSIYAKAEEHTMFEFVWYGDNGVFSGQTRFDLDAETITLGPATRGTITHVRDGWYKCEASRVSGATAAGYYGIYMVEESTGDSSYVGLNDGGLYFFGAQFEEGDFPTSYIPSDTRFTSRSSVATHYDETGILRTAPANSPRYGYKYDGRKWVETGLILENAATNYVPVYPDLVNRGAAVDLTLNATTAPDGSNAHLFKPTTTSTIHRIGYYGDPSLGAGNICFSVYLKAGGYRYVGLNNYHSGSKAAGFDLETGTITTIGAGCNAFIEEVTNGWYRCSVSYVTTTTNDTPNIEIRETSGSGYQSFAGDGTSGIYAWGLQMENSLAASSYIYTTNGSTATRSADIASSVAYTRPHDVAYIDKIQNKDWFDTEKGTIYADADAYGMDDAVVVGINDGSARGIRNWWISSTTEVRSAAYGGSNYTGLHYYSGIDSIAPHKMATAYSYEDATYVSALDGSTPQSTTSWAGIVTNPTTLWLGGETTTSRPFTGAIKRVAYYGEALSTAELQALTENN